jgi:RNA polymerase sigma factor (sigma-70 family)
MSDPGESPIPALVAAALDGDQQAWRELVARFNPLVTSIARRYGLAPEDAQDVMQTVCLRMVEHLSAVRDPSALPGWIATTTRNECVRARRMRAADVPTDPLEHHQVADRGPGSDVDCAMIDAERHDALMAAVAELPRRQRDLVLILIEDPPVPYDEICRRLDMPIGSIGPTRARALARIRRYPALSALRTI